MTASPEPAGGGPPADRPCEPVTFATNRAGRTTYTSPEWHALTGQSPEESLGLGWIDLLHPDDREIVRGTLVDALDQQCAFSIRYRLLCRNARCVWVAAGAFPSFGPPGRTFLGFLGSLTPIGEAPTVGLKAYGSLGDLLSPPPPPRSLPHSGLELAADHLIMAHALVAQNGANRALAALETALHELGRELAKRARGKPDRATFQ